MLLWRKDTQVGKGEHEDRHILFPGPGHECPSISEHLLPKRDSAFPNATWAGSAREPGPCLPTPPLSSHLTPPPLLGDDCSMFSCSHSHVCVSLEAFFLQYLI